MDQTKMQKNNNGLKIIIGLLIVSPFAIAVPAAAECDRVALVFNEVVCQKDVEIQFKTTNKSPLPQERLHEMQRMRLSQRIREISAGHLLDQGAYTPSDDETKRYILFQERFEARHSQQTKELIATIEHLLATYKYSSANLKRLEDALAIYRRSAEQKTRMEESNKKMIEDMRSRFGEEAVERFHKQTKERRWKMSEQWVGRWKMNKTLYEKYGGRVIFQQAGIEPIDAYRAYLKDIREKGRLKILKVEYSDLFSEFEKYLDMNHHYLNENGGKYFRQPYWETAEFEKDHQRAIDEYNSIPRL